MFSLLALAVTAMAAATALEGRRLQLRREAAWAEASVLERLRQGVQTAIYAHLNDIQMGLPLGTGSTAVVPRLEAGSLTWAPTPQQLRDLGHLPTGWTATHSMLNGAPYDIRFMRVPPGCEPAACDVEGQVAIAGPLRSAGTGTGAATDGELIGPLLTRAGADGGVSLAMSREVITGFNGTWSQPNPVPDAPAGVVAMRVGTNTAGFSAFVRRGDLRDPALNGDLSVAGQLDIAGASDFAGPVSVRELHAQGRLTAGGTAASPCLILSPTGTVDIGCGGTLQARVATFGAPGAIGTRVNGEGVTTPGRVEATGGVRAGAARMFEAGDPDAIRMEGSTLSIQGPAGDMLRIDTGGVRAADTVGGRQLALTEQVEEGSACSPAGAPAGEVLWAATAEGGWAACVQNRWVVAARFGQAGAACANPGSAAADTADGQALICRHGRYLRADALLSRFVLVQTLALQMGEGAVHVDKPLCPDSGGVQAQPLIVLSPNNEDVPIAGGTVFSGINRFAVDEGAAWRVVLEKSADRAPLRGHVIASLYCHYP